MFEKTRKDLVNRLGDLIDRFDEIAKRADDWIDKGQFAERQGLGAGMLRVLHEIGVKAREQSTVRSDSITHLLRDRALPLMFKSGVRKAEVFATQCEAVLSEFDSAEQAGKQAFRERFGQADG